MGNNEGHPNTLGNPLLLSTTDITLNHLRFLVQILEIAAAIPTLRIENREPRNREEGK